MKKLKILKTHCYIVSQKQYLQNQSFLLIETQWEAPPRPRFLFVEKGFSILGLL